MAGESRFTAGFAKLKSSDHYKSFNEACGSSNSEHSRITNTAGTTNKEDIPKALSTSGSTNSILVNPKQKGNPLLKSITNVPWEFDESIVPDYVLGRTTCALFLSLRYHTLKPDYITERLKDLGKLYDLRVLLVQVDQKSPHHALKHLTRICLLADLTLMLAWSAEEAGRIIETYKIFQHKPPDAIMEKQDSDPNTKLVNALTSIRSVNKTDASSLLTMFGSLKKVMQASQEALALCPGIGSHKAARLHKALHKPFLKSGKVTKHNSVKIGIAKFVISE